MRSLRLPFFCLAFAALAAVPAHASFHLMQIEQAAGGFCGDPGAQAVQLRMRSFGQNFVSGARLVAHDATGANPVVLIVFPSNVANSSAGSRILAATAAFQAAGGPTADFELANPIPASYLAAGRLTFESSTGLIYWSLAWGGSGYTGPTTGELANDLDGDFGPPAAEPLSSDGDQALQFQGAFGDMSTTNLADYALSASPSVWGNNAGDSAPLPGCVFVDGFESGDASRWSSSVP